MSDHDIDLLRMLTEANPLYLRVFDLFSTVSPIQP
jgi:hypothetical protein